MAVTVSVQDYPVRNWIDSSTGTGTLDLKMTVTRDHPDAATLRVCIGSTCVDIDISDIPLGQSAEKTASIECCTSAGTVQAQAGSIETCPGAQFTITAPADKARAYNLTLATPVSPADAPTKGVVLPGKSVSFKYSDNAEGCTNQNYYDVDPATVLADLTVTFTVLDAGGNSLGSAQVTITDARPFAVQAYSGNIEITVTEVL